MALSDAGLRDPSMLGSSAYARVPLDHYPTPRKTLDSFLSIYSDDVPSFQFWEPFAGNGAIYHPVAELARNALATDIKAYDGLDPDALIDFFSVFPDPVVDEDGQSTGPYIDALRAWENTDRHGRGDPPMTMGDLAEIKGFRPDAIITNPPYGELAAKAVRHALMLMKPEMGFISFLCRHEWDAAKGRSDLFDHPAFSSKITIRHRPRWIADSSGAPRHSYSWYQWDITKQISAPSIRPELFYAA